MVKQLTAIFFVGYFLSGTLCLPLGNFAALADLPQMYQHCRTFEDKDMSAFDFVTDHLINIDSIFDDHGQGDEQRPHQPVAYNHFNVQQGLFVVQIKIPASYRPIQSQPSGIYSESLHPSEFNTSVFRPPIV
ncbi:MAG: hypothetical protein JST43_06650 [Bacteroidetes bacterium]|nr:hypothetical protein [Bacteroidota bacterium]MBS1539630.1 hypothetical protein [Bacteroidota bacterium]